jgi:hypothetical protein
VTNSLASPFTGFHSSESFADLFPRAMNSRLVTMYLDPIDHGRSNSFSALDGMKKPRTSPFGLEPPQGRCSP